MFRTILVPLDGSSFGDHALPTARAIAEQTKATLHLVLVHVPVYSGYVERVPIVDPELDAASRENERAYLQAVQQRLINNGVPAPTITVLDGPVVETLAAHAGMIKADLVVMTSHGRSGVARLWLGSVADGFVRHSHVPVLIIRPNNIETPWEQLKPYPLRRILVALDGSALSEQILAPAFQLGAASDTHYTFVQVIDGMTMASAPLMSRPAEGEYESLRQQQENAHDYLERLAVPMRSEGRSVTTHVLLDTQPTHAILSEAVARNSDVIALATHGRGGVRRVVIGSVADKVLRGADKPLLLYRPPTERKQ